jgi:antibiotic biosynthesis monooxygenase (ABM) superfamily enzyme
MSPAADRPDRGNADGRIATVAVTRVLFPGKERRFEDWIMQVDVAAKRFPGHLGSVRLQERNGTHHLIYQFTSREHLHAARHHIVVARWLADLADHAQSDDATQTLAAQRQSIPRRMIRRDRRPPQSHASS